MAKPEDVTDLVHVGSIDDEILVITQCACGAEFDYWDFFVGLGEDGAKECPICGRKLYFDYTVMVYQIN